MVQTPSTLLSLDAFLQRPETKPASEFIQGKIVQKPMPKGKHSRTQQKLTAKIDIVLEDPQIALAFPELRCTFGGRSLVPDIAVFTRDRIPTQSDGNIANQFDVTPDWAIEILSPNQSSTRVISNILHCLSHGTQLGWLIDPETEMMLIYFPNQQTISLYNLDDRLPVPAFAAEIHLTLGQVFGWLKLR